MEQLTSLLNKHLTQISERSAFEFYLSHALVLEAGVLCMFDSFPEKFLA